MKLLVTSIELAIAAFTTHKVRTSLAVLGVTIGITSIIVVFAAGSGVRGLLAAQVESFGADLVQAEIKVPSSKTGGAAETQSAINLLQGAQVTTMSHDDLEDILDLPNVIDGYGLQFTSESVTYRGEVDYPSVWASSAAYINVDQIGVALGRFYTDAEDKSLAQVVVLGPKVRDSLFGDSDPLDKTIKIRDTRFRVIGVMESRGSVMGFDYDDMIYVPVRTMQKRVMGVDHFVNILVKIRDMDQVEITMEEIREIMRENHNIDRPEFVRESVWDTGKDDFRVVSMVEALEVFDSVYVAMTMLLLAIVAVSLVVGGVGVMNVMYVIVNERTPEIGLRKAVGATNRDIMTQFLMESVLITGIGGLVGIVIGVLLSWGISIGASASLTGWVFTIPPIAFITAFAFSVIFGVLFGLYPARKAAAMNPIVALQHNR